jgi:hypothetical protein
MTKTFVIPGVPACILLFSACGKTPAVQVGGPNKFTDWGVIEVVPGTPKHLQVEGKDCTLTATPLADGKFAVVIEGDFDVTGKNAPAGVPAGLPIHTTLNTTLPGNVECLFSVGQKPVRATLKLKAL